MDDDVNVHSNGAIKIQQQQQQKVNTLIAK
jgi:hypothetical protein